jgi:hypothetical protein
MKKYLSLLLLFSLYFQTAKSETEPNDNATQAHLITLIGSQMGNLMGTDANDWFLLNMPPGLLLWKWVPGCEGVMQAGRVMVVR